MINKVLVLGEAELSASLRDEIIGKCPAPLEIVRREQVPQFPGALEDAAGEIEPLVGIVIPATTEKEIQRIIKNYALRRLAFVFTS